MMTVTDRDRRDLYEGLAAALGPGRADKLMELLPNEPANELVTKVDLQSELGATRAELKGEMAELRGDLRAEMAGLRVELKGEMSELRGEMTELRSDLRGEMTELRSEMRSGMNRWAVGITAGNTLAVVTALIT